MLVLTKQKENYNQRKKKIKKIEYRHTILLHFADVEVFCFFFLFIQMEDLWQSCMEHKSICAIFPTSFAHFLSLCHIW